MVKRQNKQNMKLQLVKKFNNKNPLLSAISLEDKKAVFLTYNNESFYELLIATESEFKSIDLGCTERYYSLENNPVLFSIGKQFGVINDRNELLIYSNENQTFEKIKIQSSEILPQRVRLCYSNPKSDCDVLPICFESDGFIGVPRYIAFLKINIENKQANWESWNSLEAKSFAHHKDDKYSPKIDSVMLKDNELYVYSSGGQITSVNKWGMDYYAFVKSDKKGVVSEILFDSGYLKAIDNKKRGVNGLISSSQKYLLLTPVFQSDEWKGKQKIFSLELNEFSDITLPRGFGKYPQIVEHLGAYFWVYLRDTKEIAICIEH